MAQHDHFHFILYFSPDLHLLIYPSHFPSESICSFPFYDRLSGGLMGFIHLFYFFSTVQGPLGLDGKPVSMSVCVCVCVFGKQILDSHITGHLFT